MTKSALGLLLAGAIFLSGCDGVASSLAGLASAFPMESPPSMALVIPPGHTIIADGQVVKTYGLERCPFAVSKDYPGGLFAQSVLPSDGCTTIFSHTKEFSIRLATKDGVKIEKWTVERGENRITLRRPGGDPVYAS